MTTQDQTAGPLVTVICEQPVDEAVPLVLAALERRGVRVFAVVDHGAGASSAGLTLAPEVVVVFGDPAVGTPLMVLDPAIGVELPLRLLAWSAAAGTQLGFVDPRSWSGRYAVRADHPALTAMRTLLDGLVAEVQEAARSGP